MNDIEETKQEKDVNALGEINTSNEVGGTSRKIILTLVGILVVAIVCAAIFG